MTKCLLYAGETLLGWAELVPTDPSMGGVSGVLYPNENYAKVQPIIWNVLAHSEFAKSHTPEGKAAYAAKDALGLRVLTTRNESLEQVGPIWLIDFTDQAPDFDIELDVAGVPWWVLEREFGWTLSDEK